MATNENSGIEEFLKGVSTRRSYNFGTQGTPTPAVPKTSRSGFIDILPSGTGAGASPANMPQIAPSQIIYRGRGGMVGAGPSGLGIITGGAGSASQAPAQLSPSAMAERGRVNMRASTAAARNIRQGQLYPQEEQMGGGGGGYDPTAGIDKMFAPLFAELQQQRRNANSRYTANLGQIENIYGQLIGARKEDIGTIDEAYKALVKAATDRSTAAIGAIEARDEARVDESEAVLQSMGLGNFTAPTQLSSEVASTAQDVEQLNAANWNNFLSSMGATEQAIARADITGYGYRQGEDAARLQAAREQYLGDLSSQRFKLMSEREQARYQARANAASAAQSAANAAARAQAGATSDFLKNADPITSIIVSGMQSGFINEQGAGRIQTAYENYLSNLGNPPQGRTSWDGPSAANAFVTSPAASGLTTAEKRYVQQAIRASF